MAQDDMDQLNERLSFLGLDQDAIALLRSLQAHVAEHIQPALAIFYQKVRSTPQTAGFFHGDSHVDGAKNLQAKHWGLITSGTMNESYVQAVSRIGKMHAKIGLEPRWYIAGYALVLEQLIHATLREHWPSWFGKSKVEDLAKEISVIVKASLLDMDYAISVYLDELEKGRQTAEAARQKAEDDQHAALGELGSILTMLSAGDLETRLPDHLPENFLSMVDNYNSAAETLRQSIGTVRVAAEEILRVAQTISGATNDLSLRTVQQAAGVEESSAALHELTESVTTTATGARKAAQVVSETLTVAKSSGTVVADAVSAMSEIEGSSGQIANIIGVIDEIAFQTNLLALNAGVEAARAGDAGKGFAVVAQEVRELAQRSASAAQQIKTIIARSSQQVQTGVDLVNRSGSALNHIISKVSDINDIVSGIATAAGEQSIGLNEISSAVANMDSITQNNAGMVEKTSDEIGKLTEQVERLATALRGFKTRDPSEIDRPLAGGRRDVDTLSGRPYRHNAA